MKKIDRFVFGLFCFVGLHMPINAEWMYPEDLICEYCQKYLGEGDHPKILRSKIVEGTPLQLLSHKGPIIWYEAEWKDGRQSRHSPKKIHDTEHGSIMGVSPIMFFGGDGK